jgi:hypothetical protein
MPIIYFTNGFDNIFKGTLSATYALFLVAIQIVVFIALNGKLLLNKGQTIGKMESWAQRFFFPKIIKTLIIERNCPIKGI